MDGVTLPLKCGFIENQGEVRDDLWVSTVAITFLPIERSAPLSGCVYTYSSRNLEEAHLQKYVPNNYSVQSVYEWCTPTARNIYTSEVHLRRRHPTIQSHWRWEAFLQLKRTSSGHTLRSVKCVYGERPTQFRRGPTTTTMTTMTWMTSQSTSIMDNRTPTILWNPASKNYWRRREWWRLWTKKYNTAQKWRDAMRTCYFRLRRNQHFLDTEPSQVTRNITSGGTHHNPHHERRCDARCKGHLEEGDYSPVRGLSRTGRQIRRASRVDAGVRFSTWVTMVSQTKSWHRLGSINSLRSPSASGAEEWHRWLPQWHHRSRKPKMTSFWGAVRL